MDQTDVIYKNELGNVLKNKLVIKKPALEIPRAVFHMIAATSAIVYFYLSDFAGAMILLVVGIIFSGADILRTSSKTVRSLIPSFILNMVRDKEQDKISAITHFIIAAVLVDFLYLFFALPKDTVLAATMFAAFGDPLARLAGIRFGKRKIFNTAKTYIGSISFFVAGATTAFLLGMLLGSSITITSLLIGGAIITAIEVFSGDWDNFAVPFVGTLVFWGLLFIGI